jgi:2-amino-4-hydroxy-6-hydroxymethyldihydropteridine diphosphokinase
MPFWRVFNTERILRSMIRVVLSLGTNLERREENLERMMRELSGVLQPPRRTSRVMETEPVDVERAQPWYLNQVISAGYDGTAGALLAQCHSIERQLGRAPETHWQPRVADIDILLFDQRMICTEELIVPHPRLIERRFWLEGIAEVEPEMAVPGCGTTAKELLAAAPRRIREQRIRFLGKQAGA